MGASLFRQNPEEDMVYDGKNLHEQFDYVALGHIHKPQAIVYPHIRYSGSIERMDMGEQADQKGVILFDLTAAGMVDEPITIPLPSTPIYHIDVDTPAIDIPRLSAEHVNAAHDLVNLRIQYTAGTDQLEDVLAKLNGIFPRWYARNWRESAALGPTLALQEGLRSESFSETVREYLNQELIQHSEAERDAIVAIANRLLEKVE